jgi:hypothetical protein
MGEKRNAYEVTVGRAKGKRPFGITGHRWKNNTEIDLKYNTRLQTLDRTGSQKRAVVNTVMKLGVPQNAGNFWTSQRTINF